MKKNPESGWRYRLCKSRFHYKLGNRKRVETVFSIREVHGEKKLGWSAEGVRLEGFESPLELKKALLRMLQESVGRTVLWVGNERAERK